MGLMEWIAVGAIGLFLHSRAKQQQEEEEEEFELLTKKTRVKTDKISEYPKKKTLVYKNKEDGQEKEQNERERRSAVNRQRKLMPCMFSENFSSADFYELARLASKRVRRIKHISVSGAVVSCVVQSQTALSDWTFHVDFNNWGHVNGVFWTSSENDDSTIPHHFGMTLSGMIQDYLKENNIVQADFSSVVDANLSLETLDGLDTHYKPKAFRRFLGKYNRRVNLMHDFRFFIGEHIYPVISLLKENGFVNIKSIALEDIDNVNKHFLYEVDKVSIDGECSFEYGYAFSCDADVEIYYHSKKQITLTTPIGRLKGKNYVEVGDYLQELGFSEIYERPQKDLITGLITKDGSVANIYVEDDEEKPITQWETYPYDTKIIISYHTFK